MHFYEVVPDRSIISCPSCGRNFIAGEYTCTRVHTGTGCCHLGDQEVHVPEGTHPMPALPMFSPDVAEVNRKTGGWEGLPFVENDGKNWPLDFAAKMLDIPLRDLQDLVRITGLQPAGTIRMAGFSRKGRQPRAYPAEKLITITEAIRGLSGSLDS